MPGVKGVRKAKIMREEMQRVLDQNPPDAQEMLQQAAKRLEEGMPVASSGAVLSSRVTR